MNQVLSQLTGGSIYGKIRLEVDKFHLASFFKMTKIKVHYISGQDSCNGDSGGPLIAVHRRPFTKMFLAGIVSFGTSQCGVGLPGVYTNIHFYMPWIRENMIS